jgi:hypothetical protein
LSSDDEVITKPLDPSPSSSFSSVVDEDDREQESVESTLPDLNYTTEEEIKTIDKRKILVFFMTTSFYLINKQSSQEHSKIKGPSYIT